MRRIQILGLTAVLGVALAAPADAQVATGGGCFLGVACQAKSLVLGGAATITAPASNTLQIGGADAASPVSQTIQAQSVATGTSNTAGADMVFVASKGTGTGSGGNIVFKTAPAGTTGSSQNVLTTAMTINNPGYVSFSGTLVVPQQTIANYLTLTGNSAAIYFSNALVSFAGIGNSGTILFSNSGSLSQTYFTVDTNNTLKLGRLDSVTYAAQSLAVQNIGTGTSNAAGSVFKIIDSGGTGTGTSGGIEFDVHPAGTSGSSQNAAAAAVVINSDQTITFKGTIPTVSGTGAPTIATGSTDNAGEVTAGASATSIVITFAHTKANAPFCAVTTQASLASFAYSISNSAITVTQTANSANKIDYNCIQH